MPAITNASAEALLADKYPHIRLFTVGQKTSSRAPLSDLGSVEAPWEVANHTNIAQGGRFGRFSAGTVALPSERCVTIASHTAARSVQSAGFLEGKFSMASAGIRLSGSSMTTGAVPR